MVSKKPENSSFGSGTGTGSVQVLHYLDEPKHTLTGIDGVYCFVKLYFSGLRAEARGGFLGVLSHSDLTGLLALENNRLGSEVASVFLKWKKYLRVPGRRLMRIACFRIEAAPTVQIT